MKGSSSNRFQRKRIIERKKRICNFTHWHYKFEGELEKGKIHCSCPLCRVRTKDQNSIFGSPTYNYKASDLKKVEAMLSQLKDYDKGIW